MLNIWNWIDDNGGRWHFGPETMVSDRRTLPFFSPVMVLQSLKLVLRRFKWNSFNNEVADWGGDQVDHGDEIGHIPVASGSGASCLEETV